MFFLKKNVKYFFSKYVLLNKVCSCGGTVNYRRNFFYSYLENNVVMTPNAAASIFTITVKEATSKISEPGHCPFKVFINLVLCAIWYHLYNLKHVKNIHGEVLLLVKLQAQAFNYNYASVWKRHWQAFINPKKFDQSLGYNFFSFISFLQ